MLTLYIRTIHVNFKVQPFIVMYEQIGIYCENYTKYTSLCCNLWYLYLPLGFERLIIDTP
jgi:hypothetical protein